jgi:hypothetical protein
VSFASVSDNPFWLTLDSQPNLADTIPVFQSFSPLNACFAVCAITLLLTSCDNPAPSIVQLKCSLIAEGAVARSATFTLDLGRYTAARIDGARRGPMPLAVDEYTYSFADRSGHKISVNRYTGLMTYEPPLKSGQPMSPKEQWRCSRQKAGRLF